MPFPTDIVESAIAYQVLKPSADEIGAYLQGVTQRRLDNLRCVFALLEHKFGRNATPGDGESVSLRVLRGIMDEGSYIEDDVGRDYYAGVLAGSLATGGGDDSGVALLNVMSGLSSLQLRAHFLIYAAAQQSVAGDPKFDPYARYDEPRGGWRRTALSLTAFKESLAAVGGEPTEDQLGSVMRALRRVELIHPKGGWLAGNAEQLAERECNVEWPEPALVCTISNFGMELFCAAHGFRSVLDFAQPRREFRERFQYHGATVAPMRVADLPPRTNSA
jgi:hypothetical protein